jgi:hypothetical protein
MSSPRDTPMVVWQNDVGSLSTKHEQVMALFKTQKWAADQYDLVTKEFLRTSSLLADINDRRDVVDDFLVMSDMKLKSFENDCMRANDKPKQNWTVNPYRSLMFLPGKKRKLQHLPDISAEQGTISINHSSDDRTFRTQVAPTHDRSAVVTQLEWDNFFREPEGRPSV